MNRVRPAALVLLTALCAIPVAPGAEADVAPPARIVRPTQDRSCGEYQTEVTLVNMTPDAAVTPAARECASRFAAALGDESVLPDRGCELVGFQRLGETAARQRLRIEAPADFWLVTDEALGVLEDRASPLRSCDTFVLFDCRPEERRIRVRVIDNVVGSSRFELGGVDLDRARATWAGRLARHIAGSGGC